MFSKTILSLSTTAILIAGAASAETQASTWTDLNMRSGPGPMYSIVGVIPANEIVMVQGCTAEAGWCLVTRGDVTGWSAGNYLTTSIALSSINTPTTIQTVTYDHETEAAQGGLAAGAIAGAIIAGPPGAIVGGIIGAVTGTVFAPDPTVVTYITENPVENIYLDGEVVVGAQIPETVTFAPVPDTTYSYAYINGVRVLVETGQRAVIYIAR